MMSGLKRKLRKLLFTASGLSLLRWHTLPAGLYCFNFHRVGDPANCPFDRGVFSCTQIEFGKIVDLLRRRFRIISLTELVDEVLPATTVAKRPLAMLTFDDGYIDNYELAFPILKNRGVSATFFVPTGFIDTGKIYWWDDIAWSVRHAQADRLSLPGHSDSLEIDRNEMERSIRLVLEAVKVFGEMPIGAIAQHIRDELKPPAPSDSQKRELFLNWSHAREMKSAGMDIGSHTHTHRILAQLSTDEQRDELFTPKTIIEKELGQPPLALAYPVGRRNTFTEQTIALAKQAGYKVAFSFITGRIHLPIGEDSFTLPRFSIDSGYKPWNLRLHVGFPQVEW